MFLCTGFVHEHTVSFIDKGLFMDKNVQDEQNIQKSKGINTQIQRALKPHKQTKVYFNIKLINM